MNENFESDKPSFELSESGRELVARVERLALNEFELTELLLVWRGLKQATEVDFVLRQWEGDETPPPINTEKIETQRTAILGVLRDLNLAWVTGAGKVDQSLLTPEERNQGVTAPAREYQRMYVGKTADDLERLRGAEIEVEADTPMYWDTWERHQRTLGELYGFPKTAVEAYIQEFRGEASEAKSAEERGNKFSQLTRDLPAEVRNQDFTAFAFYRTSKEHWQTELETAKQWAEELQKVSPKLFEKIVSDYRNDPW
jgi:predicted transcriptional regulator